VVFSAEIVGACVVGRGWRWETDLTSVPSGSRTQARSGLHQRVGAGPRPWGRAQSEGRGGPRDDAGWAVRRGEARWASAAGGLRGAGRGGESARGGGAGARAGPRCCLRTSWAARAGRANGPRLGRALAGWGKRRGRGRAGWASREHWVARERGGKQADFPFLFISFPISSSFLFSSRCQIEFLIKPMLHEITHQTK
jgi:hypothetical protein